MNPSGYDIKELVLEAQHRWLKPAEVLFILQTHDSDQITNEPSQKPPSGSLFLFNKRVLRFFRKDGHSWRRKKDGRTVGEAHERLKVGNVEAINCYYAHGEHNPNFQRRSYWMLDPAHEHIVLVHYRDIYEGRQNAGVKLQSSLLPVSDSADQSPYSNQALGSSMVIGEYYEPYVSSSSPGSGEITSDAAVTGDGVNHLDSSTTIEEVNGSPSLEMNQALRKLKEQLSLDDERFEEIDDLGFDNENPDDFGPIVSQQPTLAPMQPTLNGHQSCQNEGDNIHNHQLLNHEANVWGNMLDTYGASQNVGIQSKYEHRSYENPTVSRKENVEELGAYNFLDYGGNYAQKATPVPQDMEGFMYHPYPPSINSYGSDPNDYAAILDQSQNGASLEDGLSLTISQKQKFSIQEISPEWGYASETTKVIIVGSFLHDPSETVWTCMLGDIEVPVQIVRDGVMRCLAPPHLPGKVSLCITSSNRESCSEVREFEYRVKPTDRAPNSVPETDSKSPEELLLLVRFVQTLLSSLQIENGGNGDPKISFLSKARAGDDSWEQVIEALLFGSWTPATTTDWLLEELLKDKLQQWLYFVSPELDPQIGCSLSKKEQGIIHMIAGLGFEWALHPILNSGVSVNFRDINGWTALHWAARFGREKMVAELMASGALPGAVTDPDSHDPNGRTPASIAATFGHHGLAGYLSEVALTSHLESLTLEKSELSKGSTDVEAERTVSSISNTTLCTSEDDLSLKHGLAAVRNATQAAARIQSAFRAHSFRKRQLKKAISFADSSFTNEDEYDVLSNDIEGLSAASKLVFRNARDYSSAAVSIQKKYRGWKGRKDFLAFRQKVVKIQAHVRGYQVRKEYKVCWATGILEKVVLRWRRRGVGLRGFRHDSESIDETEDEDDILKVFRKQKVNAAIDEAVSRVLLMVECPDARQQYRRILEKYRQAKAEREGEAEKEKAETSNDDASYMENDGGFLLM